MYAESECKNAFEIIASADSCSCVGQPFRRGHQDFIQSVPGTIEALWTRSSIYWQRWRPYQPFAAMHTANSRSWQTNEGMPWSKFKCRAFKRLLSSSVLRSETVCWGSLLTTTLPLKFSRVCQPFSKSSYSFLSMHIIQFINLVWHDMPWAYCADCFWWPWLHANAKDPWCERSQARSSWRRNEEARE